MKQIDNLKWLEKNTGRCANCKKKFPKPTAEWGYDYKGKECCSYHCMRALERKDKNSYLHIKEEEERTRKRRQQEQAMPSYTRIYVRQDARSRPRLTNDEKEEIIRLYVQGYQIKQIAFEIRRSIDAIAKVLDDANVRKPEQRSKWITEEQKEDMRRYSDEGKPADWIAEKLGCSERTVMKYIK